VRLLLLNSATCYKYKNTLELQKHVT
jgi:hypothetical protein